MYIHHYELSALDFALTCPNYFLKWADCGVHLPQSNCQF